MNLSDPYETGQGLHFSQESLPKRLQDLDGLHQDQAIEILKS